MKILDDYKISWLGWEFKTYARKTGFNDGIFDESKGDKRSEVLGLYSRPYAHAVPGVINYMNYDDHTGKFTLVWTVPPYYSSKGAVISTGKRWHYPKGMMVKLTPNISSYHENGDFIYVNNVRRQYAQTIKIEILQVDSYK